MRRSGGLASRLTRLEAADSAACPACHGNPVRIEWARGPGQPRDDGDETPDTPQTCAGCGRPYKLMLIRWRTDEDGEAP